MEILSPHFIATFKIHISASPMNHIKVLPLHHAIIQMGRHTNLELRDGNLTKVIVIHINPSFCYF